MASSSSLLVDNVAKSDVVTIAHRSSNWPQELVIADILNRTTKDADEGRYVYDVAWRRDFENSSPNFESGVPHSAIRFIDKPWQNDQQLPQAFRHPMRFPDEMTPIKWKS